jgi:acyl carrier protein
VKDMKALEDDVRRIAECESIDDSLLIDDLDSLARAEVIVAVESEFGVQLSNEEILTKMKTFGDLKRLIEEKVR